MISTIKPRDQGLVLFILGSLLLSCGVAQPGLLGIRDNSGADSASRPDNEYQARPPMELKDRLDQAFMQLRSDCQMAGGAFQERSKSCVCPLSKQAIPQSFQAVYRMDPSLGLKRRVFDHFACQQQYLVRPSTPGIENFSALLRSDRNSFLLDLSTLRNAGNGRSLRIEVDGSVPDSRLQELAEYLDRVDTYIDIPSGHQWRELFHVHIFPKLEDVNPYKRIPYFDFEDTSLLEREGNDVFIWEVKDLQHLRAPSLDSLESIPSQTNGDPEFMQAMDAYQSFVRQESSLDITEDVLNIDEGCHKLCDYRVSFRMGAYFYWVEKNYARGGAFREAFYRGTEDGILTSVALLFRDRTPSLLIQEQQQFQKGADFKVTTEAYSSQNELIHSNTQFPLQSTHFLEQLHQMKSFDAKTPQTNVLVLEEKTQLEEDWELSYWLRGPFASESPASGQSLYGWIAPQVKNSSLFSFLFGVMDITWTSDVKHGREVLHDLMRDIKPGDAYAIATDFSWLLEGKRFDELVKISRARIATISAILSVDEKECNRLLAQMNADILWVAGAGNEATENPRFRCPQRMARKDHRLVVAAGTPWGLASFADYGFEYADIAADPNSYLDRRGSSYSAPKVANVALKIVRSFGERLSNPEVRLAILLGAEVDPKHRLGVRTGGALSEEFALKAAAAIVKLSQTERRILLLGNDEREQLLGRIIQASGALSEADAREQAKLLTLHDL